MSSQENVFGDHTSPCQPSQNQQITRPDSAEIGLGEISMSRYGAAISAEYVDLCESLWIDPTVFQNYFDKILNPVAKSELTAVLTGYSSLFTGDVKDRVQEIAVSITQDPRSKIDELLEIINTYSDNNPDYLSLIQLTQSLELADFERQRLFQRIMLEVAVGYRVLGDQNGNMGDYNASEYHFNNIITFALQNGDLPLLVEAIRHSVNLYVNKAKLHQKWVSENYTDNKVGEDHRVQAYVSKQYAKHLCLLASAAFNVLERKDKVWVGKGELLGFNGDYATNLLALFSEQSNVIHFVVAQFPPKVQKAILQAHKCAVKFKGAIN